MPTLSQRWETAPAYSCPVCLPRVDPNFFTSLLAERCQQPPKVSATSGRKAKPCLLHVSSAPSSFPLWAWSQSQPWGPDLDGGGDFHVHGRVLAASPVGPGPGRQLGAYCSREGGSSLPSLVQGLLQQQCQREHR